MLMHNCAHSWTEKQGGVYLYLRDVHGHLEARLWAQLFDAVEELMELPRGTVRATVMIDSIAGALEADEILFELMHHAAGLSVDPQGYAADHIALFHGPDRAVLPDRETIVLNAPMLRALSLRIIGICHRRGCHAIGAPSFVLPPLVRERMKASYLEMLGDKEREAVDGFDGTIVVDGDSVNPAMVEFNKSMPRANQLYYLRNDDIRPTDLIQRPEGAITVDSLVGMIRTTLRFMVERDEGRGWVIQGGRKHDRSSLRLSLRLLWQWNHSSAGVDHRHRARDQGPPAPFPGAEGERKDVRRQRRAHAQTGRRCRGAHAGHGAGGRGSPGADVLSRSTVVDRASLATDRADVPAPILGA